MRWDKKDIPHKGWTEIGMEDLGEEAEFGEDIEYERCEMCGNEKIRYVHIMTHPEFPGELRVGCICACHMTDDYENPEARERDLKNRVAYSARTAHPFQRNGAPFRFKLSKAQQVD